MRTMLFTASNDKYRPLADLTVPMMSRYAHKHGYDFEHVNKLLGDPHPDTIYWVKAHRAIELLEDYARVIWLDVDQLITNPSVTFDLPPHGFHVSKDWGNDATEPWHFSVCGFVAHRDCLGLIEMWLGKEPESRDKPFPEQNPLREIVKDMVGDLPHMRLIEPSVHKWNGLINVHQRKVFNAVPASISPGNVPEPWEPSDFAAHITMLGIDERVKLAKKILNAE